jgi:phosphoglycerate kinase
LSKFSNFNFNGQKALIRVDFNVSLDANYQITDDNRMRATIPTTKKILSDGGSVILMSHLGRPKDGPSEKYSLKHLVQHLSELLGGTPVQFGNDCIGTEAYNKAAALQSGEELWLENLRFYKEEELGEQSFAEKLAKLGTVYVNDAFGTAHRAHASTAVIAQLFPADKKMFGLLMEAEVSSAEKIMHEAEKPFVAIIGGAQISDKILIIENLLKKTTDIIIGGVMAYTFMMAKGGSMGSSL